MAEKRQSDKHPPAAAGPADLNALVDADALKPRPWWKRRDDTAEVAGWMISAALHVLLAIVALMVVWSVVIERPDHSHIVPIAFLSPEPGTPLTDPTRQPLERPTTLQRQVEPPQRSLERPAPQTPGQQRMLASQPTLSSLSSLGPSADSSPLAATFYGTGGNARRIAYIVDASGSLIDTLDFVLQELRRSISQLSDQQQFTVIFFQADQVIEAPPTGWKRADGRHKQQVVAWMSPEAGNIRAMGGTSPVPAIRQALRYRPELVFLLSDNITGRGRYEVNQAKLLSELAELNNSNTKFNTIQFLYPDPLADKGMRGTLELIAEQTGGVYRFVSGRELDIR